MITGLRIENFALIERLDLELAGVLTVLTGETGAGKSIIIDAVSLLLGGRAAAEFIRSGCERALVEGLFGLDADMPLTRHLAELGYALDNGDLLLTRELSASGRNTCRLQGRLVPLNLYREIGAQLIDIHGQHDYQSLLHPENHLLLLDSLAAGTTELKAEVQQAAQSVLDTRQQLDKLIGDARDAARREDMLKFQLEEIDGANLADNEAEELLGERVRLVNAEKLAALTATAYASLFAGLDRQQSAIDLTAAVLAGMKDLAAIDVSVEPMLDSLATAFYQMEEVAQELRHYRENIVFDPVRRDEVEDRLALIKSLTRKYGGSIAEIMAYRDEAAAELAVLSQQDELQAELLERLTQAEEAYQRLADVLTAVRKKSAIDMATAVSRELAELKMPNTEFEVHFDQRDRVHPLGQDVVEFMFSPNHGEPLKPLTKTASGGEMSRVILALKTLLAQIDPVPTLIFDEVDSGVGGEAVRMVAEKLAQIAQTRQVLCVTHSPQVASFATTHLMISKDTVAERTVTRVKLLAHEERKLELARMLGGNAVSRLTLEHAAEMLQNARRKA